MRIEQRVELALPHELVAEPGFAGVAKIAGTHHALAALRRLHRGQRAIDAVARLGRGLR